MFIPVAIAAIDRMDENETRITETTTANIRTNAKQEFANLKQMKQWLIYIY